MKQKAKVNSIWANDDFAFEVGDEVIIDTDKSYKRTPEEDNYYEACEAYHGKHWHGETVGGLDICLECVDYLD